MEYYNINHRRLTAFSPLTVELAFEPQKNYLFELSYLSALYATGEQSRSFLQGQLSCDIREINPQEMRPGTLCNLKGRVLALLDVIEWGNLQLILPEDMLTATQASLAKIAIFSKVALQRSSSVKIFGFRLQNLEDHIPFNIKLPKERFAASFSETLFCYHLGNGLYILLVQDNIAATLVRPFQENLQWRGSLAWHVLQLQQGFFEIYPDTRGLFLPHRLGLHHSGHISFDKGCYKGQEIIARTHYRAKLKHQMKIFKITTTETLQSGKKLLSYDGKTEIGELVDFGPIDDKQFLIAASVVFATPDVCLIEGHQEAVRLESV